ncbi:hypothetical protein [Moorena sp. SIO4G3]|nr:hypothetical protein [Moorena sp. SIO4G3]NEO74823.1 hypothetical protein [Moorena sp. SIO4G3]
MDKMIIGNFRESGIGNRESGIGNREETTYLSTKSTLRGTAKSMLNQT